MRSAKKNSKNLKQTKEGNMNEQKKENIDFAMIVINSLMIGPAAAVTVYPILGILAWFLSPKLSAHIFSLLASEENGIHYFFFLRLFIMFILITIWWQYMSKKHGRML